MALRRLTTQFRVRSAEFGVVRCVAILLGISVYWWSVPAEAAIVRGIQEVLAGVLQIPLSTIAGTFNGPPIIGTLFGALGGAVKGVGLVAHGALELAASGVSLAKTIGPYLLPFLL